MKIGDRIVYPMHGAGEVIGIEENEVAGVKSSYYILRLSMGSLKLMLPVDKIEEIGLRDVIEPEKVEEVAEVLRANSERIVGSWNKRFHATVDRMKTGNILEVAAVARNLSRQYRKRKISSGERRLMDLARQILISELVYVFNKPPEEVVDWVDENIDSNSEIDEESSPEITG